VHCQRRAKRAPASLSPEADRELGLSTRPSALAEPLSDMELAAAAQRPDAVCDFVLDAAMAAEADTIWLEPRLPREDRYDITVEHAGRVIACATLDGTLGAAVIARLALLADVDPIARRVTTGRCTVRGPRDSADLVVTSRPGRTPRAEVSLRKRGSRGTPPPGEPVTLEPGARVGQYRIVEAIGAGGMGQVFRVTHEVLGRSHALKVLGAKSKLGDPEAAGRFLREARAAARIKHPHIVDVFDFGYVGDGRPYLVMELVEGRSLAAVINGVALDARIAVSMARQLASALGTAHAAGVIHADVSPSNVLVVGEDAKLVDFGLAQLVDDPARTAEKSTEFVFGTPSYIAPEMIRGHGAEPHSDQYSLGAVLFEMLTGRPPYRGKTVKDLCVQHLSAPIPEPISPYGALPPEVGAVVTRCLAKNPAQRFPSMAELQAALAEAEQAVFVRGWRRWLTP
jgi:hypothetical protein